MYRRRILSFALAGAALAGLAVAGPASAVVAYDPATRTGFVGEADVRKAFGWTGATLAARAPGIVFDHDFWTDDTYTVFCAGRALSVVHHRDFGRFELIAAVARAAGRGAPGYRGKLTGFRLTGARFGISGTSVPPANGRPCPPDQVPGATMDRVRLVSTVTGWALTATSGNVHSRLKGAQTPA
jgi:hypothetical protein